MSPETSEQRTWWAVGNRIYRQSVNGDAGGAEDDFPCMNEVVAKALAAQLNDDRHDLQAQVEALKAALREIRAIEKYDWRMWGQPSTRIMDAALDEFVAEWGHEPTTVDEVALAALPQPTDSEGGTGGLEEALNRSDTRVRDLERQLAEAITRAEALQDEVAGIPNALWPKWCAELQTRAETAERFLAEAEESEREVRRITETWIQGVRALESEVEALTERNGQLLKDGQHWLTIGRENDELRGRVEALRAKAGLADETLNHWNGPVDGILNYLDSFGLEYATKFVTPEEGPITHWDQCLMCDSDAAHGHDNDCMLGTTVAALKDLLSRYGALSPSPTSAGEQA